MALGGFKASSAAASPPPVTELNCHTFAPATLCASLPHFHREAKPLVSTLSRLHLRRRIYYLHTHNVVPATTTRILRPPASGTVPAAPAAGMCNSATKQVVVETNHLRRCRCTTLPARLPHSKNPRRTEDVWQLGKSANYYQSQNLKNEQQADSCAQFGHIVLLLALRRDVRMLP